MKLSDYSNVNGPNDIRIKGSRIGIQSVLYEYIYRARTAEEIAARYPSLSLEQVYATILDYLHDRNRLDTYMATWLEAQAQAIAAQQREPAFQDFQARLRRERDRRATSVATSVLEPV